MSLKGKDDGCWGLLISMENGEHLSLEQVQAFLTGNEEIEFKAPNRKELYEWTQRTLGAQSYANLHRSGKGLMKRYIGKVTGLSRAQVDAADRPVRRKRDGEKPAGPRPAIHRPIQSGRRRAAGAGG
jgi:hypothetical protein